MLLLLIVGILSLSFAPISGPNGEHLHATARAKEGEITEPEIILEDPALADHWKRVRFGESPDVLLSVDEQGNLRIYLPVERIVYFDSLGEPIGLAGSSPRCEKSANESYHPTAVICLADDQLSRSTP